MNTKRKITLIVSAGALGLAITGGLIGLSYNRVNKDSSSVTSDLKTSEVSNEKTTDISGELEEKITESLTSLQSDKDQITLSSMEAATESESVTESTSVQAEGVPITISAASSDKPSVQVRTATKKPEAPQNTHEDETDNGSVITTEAPVKPADKPDPPKSEITTGTEAPTEKPEADPPKKDDSPVKVDPPKKDDPPVKVDPPKVEITACSHTWVWKTHTETKTIPEKSHEVPVYDDGWDEAVTVRKIYCSECENLYEDNEDYYAHDKCHGSFGHMTVIDHYIHHEPEILYYDTIVDEPAHEETVTVKDYEYCSKCGEKK
ncbi:MAG: hypothetical protein IKN79_03155 [Eubacterium sp.]|nr:hypothetical protein [Eubacterium sp.]